MPAFNLVEPLSQSLPLWAIGLVLILVSMLALEGGAWVARRQLARRQAGGDGAPENFLVQGYIIGSIFGLLAFLIGLTFSIALDRYDTRRGWIAEEATAISTTYLRADLFDEPYRSQLRLTLRAYTRSRILPDGVSTEDIARQSAESEALRAQLWKETRAAVFPVRQTELGSYFVEAMNNALGVGTRRILAGYARIPKQILDVQFIYLVVAAGVLGYLLGIERNSRRFASGLLIFLFVLAFVLILDLDRPHSGAIKVSQRGIEELVATWISPSINWGSTPAREASQCSVVRNSSRSDSSGMRLASRRDMSFSQAASSTTWRNAVRVTAVSANPRCRDERTLADIASSRCPPACAG